jgi:hypothetical protein
VTVLCRESAAHTGAAKGDVPPQKCNLTCKLNYANKCLSRARVSLWRLKQKQARSTEYSEKKPCGGICREVDALPPTTKQFIVSQVRALSASPFGMRWSHQDKLLALGLYYKSPSAYRFMKRTFHLPSERTLQQYISGFNVTTGFDSYPIDDCCSNHKIWWLNMAVTVFLRVRIHDFVRIRNRELKDLAEARKIKKQKHEAEATASRGSRKAKKVMHL